MKKIKFGIIAGVIFAILDIIPMYFMEIPEKYLAMLAAFVNRFAIGLLIPIADFRLPKWVTGLVIGILLSLPDAIITKTYGPILGTGACGGLVIGIIVQTALKEKV